MSWSLDPGAAFAAVSVGQRLSVQWHRASAATAARPSRTPSESSFGNPLALPLEGTYQRWLQLGALSPVMQTCVPPWWVSHASIRELRGATRPCVIAWCLTSPRPRSARSRKACRSCGRWRFAFPEDKAAHGYWDQYLFGPDLLVAPIHELTAELPLTTRVVYLPASGFGVRFLRDRRSVQRADADHRCCTDPIEFLSMFAMAPSCRKASPRTNCHETSYDEARRSILKPVPLCCWFPLVVQLLRQQSGAASPPAQGAPRGLHVSWTADPPVARSPGSPTVWTRRKASSSTTRARSTRPRRRREEQAYDSRSSRTVRADRLRSGTAAALSRVRNGDARSAEFTLKPQARGAFSFAHFGSRTARPSTHVLSNA